MLQVIEARAAFVTRDKDKKKQEEEAANNQPMLYEKSIKHPLRNSWTLWYFMNDKSIGWEENLKAVSTVSYIEDFWALYHHVTKVSDLRSGCDYSLFKGGIKPM